MGRMAAGPTRMATVGRSLGARAKARISGSRLVRGRRLASARAHRLLFLYDVHPDARMAPQHELGIREVPLREIRGTAVAGLSRAGDFTSPASRQSPNWKSRWSRIVTGIRAMDVLPPVELLKTADGYWVLDGHNRVAAALYEGQLEIDALVSSLRLQGAPAERPEGSLAGMLYGREALQAVVARSPEPNGRGVAECRSPACAACA